MRSYEPHYYEYARSAGGWTLFPRREVLGYLKERARAGDALLEIGCGTAEILGVLPASVSYTGVERSAYAVESAGARWQSSNPGARFLAGEAEHLPFHEGEFDFVLMLYTLEHVADPKGALLEAVRVLKPNGNLIILAPNLEFPLASPNAIRHKSFLYRIWFKFLRFGDYLKRIIGIYRFRILRENFVEHTGKYEKKDDDLRYAVSSWEVVWFLDTLGAKLELFWGEKELHGWRRLARRLPAMRWYGTTLAAAFVKN
ncbi:MAG: class I SAM-dependent methyltransferase [Candidatus Sungbacteria bacterium]|nr:class I SAM-dependent methyltransferase [Candidatus Sungbacteria bacterium]